MSCGWFLIVNNTLLEKLLILWKNDTSYHISSQSNNDMGLRRESQKPIRTELLQESFMGNTDVISSSLWRKDTHVKEVSSIRPIRAVGKRKVS